MILTDEQELIRDSMRAFAQERLAPFAAEWDRNHTFPREALNELAILRDRFGGKGAKAAFVTTEPCNAAARHRAAQLDMAVIDLEELSGGQLVQRLTVIRKA